MASYIGRKLQSEDFNVQTKGQLPEVHMFEHHAEKARKRGEKDIQLANGNIRNEYKRRLQDTKELKESVQRHLLTLRAEKGAAVKAKEELVALLEEFQRPVQLQIDWMSIRAAGGKPVAEGHDQTTVDAALHQNGHDLRTSMAVLASLLAELETSLRELSATEQRYIKDIEAKTATMVLDQACMDDVIEPPEALLDKGHPLPRALMQHRGLVTENEWRNHTNVSISSGVATVEKCAAIRKRVVSTVKSFRDSGKTRRPTCVVDALTNSIKGNTHSVTSLRMNAKMVHGEIAMLEKQHAMLNGSLEKVQQQLHTARQRLQLRNIRPASEQVRAGVEEVLEVEVINMRNTEANLQKEINELIAKRSRLVQLLEKLNIEIDEKERILAVDRKCADQKMAALPQLSPRHMNAAQQLSPRIASSSVRTPRSSPRR